MKYVRINFFQGFGAKCTQVLGSGTNRKEIEEILRVHNDLRAKIANGLENRGRPGPQPSAADMEQMVRTKFKKYSLVLLLSPKLSHFTIYIVYNVHDLF